LLLIKKEKVFAYRKKEEIHIVLIFCSLPVIIEAIFLLFTSPGPEFLIYDFNNGWEHGPGL